MRKADLGGREIKKREKPNEESGREGEKMEEGKEKEKQQQA